MAKRLLVFIVLFSNFYLLNAQKSKLNSAWRGLSDYQATLKEKPEVSYLMKAKEAIDLATTSEETKTNPKTYEYRAQIYYELFKYNLKAEDDKLLATVSDKNKRREEAYSNVSTAEFLEAVKAMEFLKKNTKDPKAFQEMMSTGLTMVDDMNNLAVGRYKAKKYDEAADFFENSFILNSLVNESKRDTVSLFNAALSAQKAKNPAKVVRLSQKMIDEKIGTASTFQTLYTSKLALQDTAGAMQALAEGRKNFPADLSLMNLETDSYLRRGKQEEALANLNQALQRDPNNAVLHLITANTYDNMANPKGADGKDLEKPANFNDLFLKAEDHYKRTIDLKPANSEYSYNASYNLGAMYYNYGTHIYNKGMNDATITKLAAKQKEIIAQSNEQYKKAIPYFEQALTFKADDTATLQSLRRLYLLIGNEAKAAEITIKLNKK
jgi:hypothetical protein